MTEIINAIPARLKNVAVNGHVAGVEDIYDDTKGKTQQQINTEVEQSLGTGGSVDERIAQAVNTEKARAQGVEATKANANDVYTKAQGTALEGSVAQSISQQNANIDSKFSTASATIANRQAAIESEQAAQRNLITSEFAEQDEKMDTMQATINAKQLEIGAVQTDLEPTIGSGNHLTSGTIASTYGSYTENPEYLQVTTDSEDKILEGIKADGTKVIGADTEIGGNATVSGDAAILGNVELSGATYTLQENPEWIKVLTDSEDKIIAGVKRDGSVLVDTIESKKTSSSEVLFDASTGHTLEISGTATIESANVNELNLSQSALDNLKIDLDIENRAVSNRLFDIECQTDNRLANPLFTSRTKYNIDNPNAQILQETAISRGSGDNEIRLPINIITNSGTVLVAAESSANGPVEHGATSIDIARKQSGSDAWIKTRVFNYESYGQFSNASFVVDRTGIHGQVGRIYLFSGYGSGEGGEIADITDIVYENTDLLYVYSDDDGLTWSTPTSLKSLYTDEKYTMILPSPNTGIQLTDGTLVVPVRMYKNPQHYSAILYKKPGENWTLSNYVPYNYQQGNESAVVEIETNIPTLYIRNENPSKYDINDAEYIQGINDQIYHYSFSEDNWTKEASTYTQGTACQFSIIKCTLNNTKLYLRSGLDTNSRLRINPTIWVSSDCKRWLRVYRLFDGNTNAGYSSIYVYNNKIVVSYEVGGNYIYYQDISDIIQLFLNSLSYASSTISIQDRLQLLFNKLNSID